MITETTTQFRLNTGKLKGEILATRTRLVFLPEPDSQWTDAELSEVCEIMSKLQPLTDDE